MSKVYTYKELQELIDKLYETTKDKGYTEKERQGAKKFALALKSKLSSIQKGYER